MTGKEDPSVANAAKEAHETRIKGRGRLLDHMRIRIQNRKK